MWWARLTLGSIRSEQPSQASSCVRALQWQTRRSVLPRARPMARQNIAGPWLQSSPKMWRPIEHATLSRLLGQNTMCSTTLKKIRQLRKSGSTLSVKIHHQTVWTQLAEMFAIASLPVESHLLDDHRWPSKTLKPRKRKLPKMNSRSNYKFLWRWRRFALPLPRISATIAITTELWLRAKPALHSSAS